MPFSSRTPAIDPYFLLLRFFCCYSANIFKPASTVLQTGIEPIAVKVEQFA
jgi:hypothetical protein